MKQHPASRLRSPLSWMTWSTSSFGGEELVRSQPVAYSCRFAGHRTTFLFCREIVSRLLCWCVFADQSNAPMHGNLLSIPSSNLETLKGRICRKCARFHRPRKAFCPSTPSRLESERAVHCFWHPKCARIDNLLRKGSCRWLVRSVPFRLS